VSILRKKICGSRKFKQCTLQQMWKCNFRPLLRQSGNVVWLLWWIPERGGIMAEGRDDNIEEGIAT
jgi:hypothetical protein